MRFAFTDDQLLFRDTVRELLAKECPPEAVRTAWAADDGRLPELWAALAEMGVVGLLVPEAHGGMGLDELDLVLLAEETGRAGMPGPFVDTAAVAATLLAELPADGTDALLAELAAGSATVSVHLGRPLGPLAEGAAAASHLLDLTDGRVRLVPCGECTFVAQPSVDGARRLVEVVPGEGQLLATGSEATDAVDLAVDRGALATAAQLLGLSQQMLDLTVGYVKERHQFGVPIGSFQAVKHHLADALLKLEFARPAVYAAAWSVSRALPSRAVDVSLGKALASDAARFVAGVALQAHGAIGYTVECDLHLYMKRAWALSAAWGDPAWHRRRIGDAVLGPVAPSA